MRHPHEWESRYREGRTGWDRGGTNPALLQWLDMGNLKPCRILIPGCGRGHEAIELARRGFDVTAVDFAPSAIRHLNRALDAEGLSANTCKVNVLDYIPDKPFDAIYEQTCICALPPEVWPDYTNRLYGWLKPNGKLFVLFMQTMEEGGPPYHCGLLQMRRLFSDDRWQWPQTGPLLTPHHQGLFELGYILERPPL
jgi:SAM-dependent methyltransferase